MAIRQAFKYTTAVLFAVIAVVLLHYVVWLFAMWQAEKGLRARLDALATQGLTYGQIRQGGYPARIVLLVDDVAVRWTDPQSPDRLVYHVGELVFETTLTGDLHIELNLPSTQQLDVVSEGKRKSYDILIEGGQIASFRDDEVRELSLNANAVSIFERQRDGRVPLVKTGDLFFTRRAPQAETAPLNWDWRLSVNKVNLKQQKAQWDNLLLDLGMKGYPESRFHELVLLLLGSNGSDKNEFAESMLREIAAKRARVTVNNIKLAQQDWWLTFRGDVGVDTAQRLAGTISVSSNNLGGYVSWLAGLGLVQRELMSQNPQLARSMGEKQPDGAEHVNVNITQGDIIFNGVEVGQMPRLMSLVE